MRTKNCCVFLLLGCKSATIFGAGLQPIRQTVWYGLYYSLYHVYTLPKSESIRLPINPAKLPIKMTSNWYCDEDSINAIFEDPKIIPT